MDTDPRQQGIHPPAVHGRHAAAAAVGERDGQLRGHIPNCQEVHVWIDRRDVAISHQHNNRFPIHLQQRRLRLVRYQLGLRRLRELLCGLQHSVLRSIRSPLDDAVGRRRVHGVCGLCSQEEAGAAAAGRLRRAGRLLQRAGILLFAHFFPSVHRGSFVPMVFLSGG